MAKKTNRKKQLRVIKNGKFGASVFWYLVIFAISVGAVIFSLMITTNFIINEKMKAEYEKISYLAKIYEQEQKQGLDVSEFYAYVDRDFFVRDAKGNVIDSRGKNNCSMIKGQLFFLEWVDSVYVYGDNGQSWLAYDEKTGRYSPDLQDMVSQIWKGRSAIGEELDKAEMKGITVNVSVTVNEEDIDEDDLKLAYDNGNKYLRELNDKNISFPIWYSIPISDGQEEFVGKGTVLINYSDALFMMSACLIIIFLMVLVLIAIIINLSRSAKRQKNVVDAFMKDPVTQGRNWTWFLSKQEPWLKRRRNAGKNFAITEVVFVNYRVFCSCHSLEEGEEMLCKINEVIAKYLMKTEACAHVATSSFVVLMQYEDEEQLRTRLRGLIESLENIDSTHKFAYQLGVKLLKAEIGQNGKAVSRKNLNLEKEYNNACMARATLADSNESRIAFFDKDLLDEQKWIDDVQERQANAVSREEFVVYYQPKYDPKTKKLRGAEALIRWNSPDMGFIPPGKFIPIFEKNGFITEIDHYMITHVARDQKAWLDQGYECVPVSVNVSRAHFIESDLAEQIKAIVDQAGAPHELIEIELTESAFFDDKNAMLRTILKLKEYGFKVSMDDFGSGYSSLNSLKDMPLDVLKLDAEFFRGEAEGGRGEIVVAEAIKLAKNLNMHTVAEGVEEKEQVEFLANQGCDMIQGYYFAKPMPKEQYEERMKTGISEKDSAVENQEAAKTLEPEAESENQKTTDMVEPKGEPETQ